MSHVRNKNSNIRFLVVNANSVKGKSAKLEHMLDYVKPDIVTISETKIDKTIYSSEFLPKNYVPFRKDRNIHG